MTLWTKVLLAACWIGSVLGVGLGAQDGDGGSRPPQIAELQRELERAGVQVDG